MGGAAHAELTCFIMHVPSRGANEQDLGFLAALATNAHVNHDGVAKRPVVLVPDESGAEDDALQDLLRRLRPERYRLFQQRGGPCAVSVDAPGAEVDLVEYDDLDGLLVLARDTSLG